MRLRYGRQCHHLAVGSIIDDHDALFVGRFASTLSDRADKMSNQFQVIEFLPRSEAVIGS